MPIVDKNTERQRTTLSIEAENFNGFGASPEVGESGTTVHAVGAMRPGAGSGAPYIQEVSTFGFGDLVCATAGDTHSFRIRVPTDLDIGFYMGVYVRWTSGSATVADTISWIVLADFFANGVVVAAPTTVLDTVITLLDAVEGAFFNQRTSQGRIAVGSLPTRAQIVNGSIMVVSVEMDAFAAGLTEDKFLSGVDLTYMPRLTTGTGNIHDFGLGE